MNMRATFIADDGTKTTYQGEQAWAALIAFRSPYKGVPKMPPLVPRAPKKRSAKGYKGAPKLTQLPSGKENYRTKNGAGGRKAMFTQSPNYKSGKFDGCAIPWGEGSRLFNQCMKIRAELVQAIAKG